MGLLDSFEKGIERAVNGAFAKTFRSGVQPVEIASALRAELDSKAAVVSRDRILVPNTLVVRLAPADHERMSALGRALHDELLHLVEGHAREQNYSFSAPVSISIDADDKLSTGTVRVDARSAAAAEVSWQGVVEIDGRQHPLTQSRTVIGRGTDADITISDAGTSRRHVEILWDGRRAMARDLGSTNGTQVNGQKVPEAALSPDSVVTIGRTRIIFRVVATAPRPPARPADDDATRLFNLGGSA
ncbi:MULTISPECIES: FhaA domain-containing protein [unclassified Microbacterium]|uniref:FhaA domain-containing protein n=1 Tax=unclassified Microbacterium TaxID=2609290 RepID=UPI00386F0720